MNDQLRAEYKLRGIERAKKFTWHRAARTVIDSIADIFND